ncbi:uncharacterized protein BYT42DRAFT_646338 [Radiomyces spectabilis]|uniref:uncharacterized protein n=1 Tax=Radiomyces spectabilis TaxID=64574 RepID=UPI00221F6981|nr:uncharacterized protein BYT42DRAFT_646338 [Radiomyces spectabilis]KAI8374337.1 hypothetical protein BYT42DRAFT_646338 [Radiomyces spectabilis]
MFKDLVFGYSLEHYANLKSGKYLSSLQTGASRCWSYLFPRRKDRKDLSYDSDSNVDSLSARSMDPSPCTITNTLACRGAFANDRHSMSTTQSVDMFPYSNFYLKLPNGKWMIRCRTGDQLYTLVPFPKTYLRNTAIIIL